MASSNALAADKRIVKTRLGDAVLFGVRNSSAELGLITGQSFRKLSMYASGDGVLKFKPNQYGGRDEVSLPASGLIDDCWIGPKIVPIEYSFRTFAFYYGQRQLTKLDPDQSLPRSWNPAAYEFTLNQSGLAYLNFLVEEPYLSKAKLDRGLKRCGITGWSAIEALPFPYVRWDKNGKTHYVDAPLLEAVQNSS